MVSFFKHPVHLKTWRKLYEFQGIFWIIVGAIDQNLQIIAIKLASIGFKNLQALTTINGESFAHLICFVIFWRNFFLNFCSYWFECNRAIMKFSYLFEDSDIDGRLPGYFERSIVSSILKQCQQTKYNWYRCFIDDILWISKSCKW